MSISSPAIPGTPSSQFALWNLGFRPFYLLAGLYSATSMLYWIAQFNGYLQPPAFLPGPLWHAHEMIFGYTFAVIVGFLFTAVRNWTNEPTPVGKILACIVACWLAGRLFALTPWGLPAIISDTLFAVAAAAGIAVPLITAGNRRNYIFIAIILAFASANIAFYLGMAGAIDFPVRRGLQIGLDLILIVMTIVGGRVIPMFTANGVPGSSPRRNIWIERTALGGLLLLIAADLLGLNAIWVAAIIGITGLAHAIRLTLWQPWRTVHKPIVWVLHFSYAWIAVHLLLRALAMIDLVPAGAATHALTAGAIGGLTLGMMTRTARGHTGLPLETGRMETAAYLLVMAGAVVRVFGPLAAPGWYLQTIIASGALWACAFLLFIVKFWPILTRPRIDGRNG